MKTNTKSKEIRIGVKVETLPDGCIGTVVDLFDGDKETKAVVKYDGVLFSSPLSLKNIRVIETDYE